MGRKPMTEEEKALAREKREAEKAEQDVRTEDVAVAEETETIQESISDDEAKPENATEEPMKESSEKTYTQADMDAILAQKQADLDALLSAKLEEALKNRPTAVVMAKPEEMVTVMFISEVAPDAEMPLGEWGTINTIGGTVDVPKKDFVSKFLSPMRRNMIEHRELIICDGLTEAERKRFNVDYKDGETLDVMAFDNLLNYSTEDICEIFKKLCPDHQHFVARRFITAAERGDNRISREKVEALNTLSKKSDPDGMFKPIIEGLNAKSV